VKFDDAVGFVAEVSYISDHKLGFGFGLRFIDIEYEVAGSKVDGSSFGGHFILAF
jgi:hypothetical protein